MPGGMGCNLALRLACRCQAPARADQCALRLSDCLHYVSPRVQLLRLAGRLARYLFQAFTYRGAIDGLAKERPCPALQRLLADGLGTEGRDEDHRYEDAGLNERPLHFKAGHARHLDIGDHARHLGGTARIQEITRRGKRAGFPAERADQTRCRHADRFVVVDDGYYLIVVQATTSAKLSIGSAHRPWAASIPFAGILCALFAGWNYLNVEVMAPRP